MGQTHRGQAKKRQRTRKSYAISALTLAYRVKMLIKSASAGAGDAGRLGGSMEVRRGPIALGPIHGAASSANSASEMIVLIDYLGQNGPTYP